MKFKKILPFLGFSFLPALSLFSCNQVNNSSIKAQLTVSMENQADEFDIFVKSKIVQTILDFQFNDDSKAKQDYIDSQAKLGDEYLKKVQGALRYDNPITRSLNSQRSFTDNFWMKKTVADTFTKSDEIIEELTRKNWLFLLFNYKNLVFMQDQNAEGNDSESVKKIKESSENMLLYGSFYKPQSNNFLDFVVQEYSNDDYSNEKHIYILTNEGFILKIIVELFKPQPKYDENWEIIPGETETQAPNIEFYMYIFTYPKLLFSTNKLQDFDLKKYVLDTQSFSGYNEYSNNTAQVLFTDKYGGTELRYTIIDMVK